MKRYAFMKTSYFLMPAFLIVIFLTSFSLKDVAPSAYEKQKQEILLERMKFRKQYDSSSTDIEKEKVLLKASAFLEKKIVEGLIPQWYGTEWDFNGYTATPQQGKIACGYFVSTLLKHAGFNLNRYRLAQKDALSIIRTISCGEKTHEFWGINRDTFLKKAKNELKSGIFVIGLSSHVGFLYKKGEDIWFIHANYRDPIAVIREKASESDALNDSNVFILTAISGNKALMKAWILEILIKT